MRRLSWLALFLGFAFRDLYVFLGPPTGQATLRAQVGRADSVRVAVYDAAGRLAHAAELGAPALLDDGNGRGPQLTYEHSWDAPDPGVYRCVVTARRKGFEEISREVSLSIEP